MQPRWTAQNELQAFAIRIALAVAFAFSVAPQIARGAPDAQPAPVQEQKVENKRPSDEPLIYGLIPLVEGPLVGVPLPVNSEMREAARYHLLEMLENWQENLTGQIHGDEVQLRLLNLQMRALTPTGREPAHTAGKNEPENIKKQREALQRNIDLVQQRLEDHKAQLKGTEERIRKLKELKDTTNDPEHLVTPVADSPLIPEGFNDSGIKLEITPNREPGLRIDILSGQQVDSLSKTIGR